MQSRDLNIKTLEETNLHFHDFNTKVREYFLNIFINSDALSSFVGAVVNLSF